MIAAPSGTPRFDGPHSSAPDTAGAGFPVRNVVHSESRIVTCTAFTPTWSNVAGMFHGQVVDPQGKTRFGEFFANKA